MTVDLDELEKLARAATPGPWKRSPKEYPPHHWDIDGTTYRENGETRTPIPCEAFGDDNAAFIAAANPNAVLELVARVRAAEELLAETAARLSLSREVIDQWVCEKVLDHFGPRSAEAAK